MIKLPKEKIKVGFKLENIRILIYGMPGIGKTTFASKFEYALFLLTESGHKGIRLYPIEILEWKDFLSAVDLILEGKHKFQTIVVDTVSNLFKMCMDYVCKKYKIEHPSDAKWGKGWEALNREFEKPIINLSLSNYGLVFIAHHKENEIKNRRESYTKIVPDIPNQARKALLPFVDIIGYCMKDDVKIGNIWREKRFMVFNTTSDIECKIRQGVPLPDRIPLDYDVFAGYFKKGE